MSVRSASFHGWCYGPVHLRHTLMSAVMSSCNLKLGNRNRYESPPRLDLIGRASMGMVGIYVFTGLLHGLSWQ